MAIRDWQPEKVKRTHVVKAAAIWDKRDTPGARRLPFFEHNFRQSTQFDVLVEGRRYPPKAIASCAHGLATSRYLSPDEFAGAAGGVWHRLFDSLGFEVIAKGPASKLRDTRGRSADQDAADDIQDIVESNRSATTRQQLIEARLGQGNFRKDVLAQWNGACAVTRCALEEALRASHIKPWREADDDERLDVNNGLPLVATLDALFDRHLISFGEDGRILISKEIEPHLAALGIKRTMGLVNPPTPRQQMLLAGHRAKLV